MATKGVVKKVLAVDLEYEESKPPTLVVTASAEVPTGGYKATLARVVNEAPPSDGVQDYVLFATPPDGIAIQVISKVKATSRWKAYTEEAPWLKGVRVHGVDGGAVVHMFGTK